MLKELASTCLIVLLPPDVAPACEEALDLIGRRCEGILTREHRAALAELLKRIEAATATLEASTRTVEKYS